MQPEIKLEYINETFFRIYCDEGIAKELSEYFTFEVPGAKFHPLVKAKRWDGKKRLFNKRDHTLYYGLLSKLHTFAVERSYTIDYSGLPVNAINVPSLEDFLPSLNIPSHFTLRDYQEKSIIELIRSKRGLLLSPTSSGKSLILYILTRYMLHLGKQKILILTPRVQLVSQLINDYEDYGGDRNDYHPIFSGQEKDVGKKVYVSTWQSLQNLPIEYFHQFDAIMVDEAHEAKAKEISRIVENSINAEYRIAVTGTLDGSETHKIVLMGLFGNVIKFISTKEMIDRGFAPKLNIKCVVFEYSDTTKQQFYSSWISYKKDMSQDKQFIAMKNYQSEMEFLINNVKRNRAIASLALSMKGNTLVTFQYVKGEKKPHGQLLYDMISKHANGQEVHFIHGETDVEIRENIRKSVEGKTGCILVASSGVFAMGINMKNLHNIILASPSKARIKLLQTIGRGLRLHESKEELNLYDIADDMRYKKKTNYTLKHLEQRINVYTEEGFPYRVRPLHIGG